MAEYEDLDDATLQQKVGLRSAMASSSLPIILIVEKLHGFSYQRPLPMKSVLQ